MTWECTHNGCNAIRAGLGEEIVPMGTLARIATLEAALREAKEVIKTWHNMDGSSDVWPIYERASPEMKRINAALAGSSAETEAKVLMTCPTCHKAYTDKDAATDMSSQMGHIAREHFQSKTEGK